MVIKVSGESPFQILSTTFSIGPSSSGYDLYFSADGVNYSKLFTVGANVNRQVTQVAAGSYYKLVGNTGNVVVNWYGNCVVDSGGGGQYVLPVASQSTLGGVKIGSGITIDSGGTISAQGGGAEVKTIVLSTTDPEQFSQEDISALTEMVEYLADFPVSGLPMARIFCGSNYYTLGFCDHLPEDTEQQTPEERYVYRFNYTDVYGDEDEYADESKNGYIQTFYLNAENVEESYYMYWDSSESVPNKLAAVENLDEDDNPQAGDVAAKKNVYTSIHIDWDSITFEDLLAIFEIGNLDAGNMTLYAWNNEGTDTLSVGNGGDLYNITQDGDNVSLPYGNLFWKVSRDGSDVSITLTDGTFANVPFEESLITQNDCNAQYDVYIVSDGLYQYNGDEWEKLGPRVILLNNLSQQELVDLYDEITAMYDYRNMAFTTAFTASDYEFYIDLTDSSKQAAIGVSDRNFEGWFPMQLNYVNPNDYDGGAIYFTGVEGRQDGNGYLFNIRYIVTNQGDTEPSCWTVEPPQPDYQHNILITSGGTIENPDGLNIFASENFNHKVMFVWHEGNDQPGWGQAPLKYVWRKLDQDNNLIYHFAVDNVPIDGVLYKGTWHVTENDWGNYTTDNWTTV